MSLLRYQERKATNYDGDIVVIMITANQGTLPLYLSVE